MGGSAFLYGPDAKAAPAFPRPDQRVTRAVRSVIEAEGDRVVDLHVWRLGPGHLGAIVSVATEAPREARFYRERLACFPSLSHVTVEVDRAA